MQVTKVEKILTNKGTHALTRYEFNTGHEAHIYRPDDFFIYTKSGNYASHKAIRDVLLAIQMHNCGA